jgi:hypothetical protein
MDDLLRAFDCHFPGCEVIAMECPPSCWNTVARILFRCRCSFTSQISGCTEYE